MGRVLAIDYGRKRIGLAVSDSKKTVALPLKTIDTDKSDPIREISNVVREYKIEEVVIGLPLLPNGREGRRAKEVKSFKDRLSESISLPIFFFDERLTTMEATGLLRQYKEPRKNKEKIDAIAAQLILESYLEKRK